MSCSSFRGTAPKRKKTKKNETCKKAFELVVLKFRLSWYIEATYACFLVEIEEEQEREEKMRSTLSSKQGTLQIRYMMIIAW